MGAKSGDVVRARSANEPDREIEGVLLLSYVPIFRNLQVDVFADDRAWYVDPRSIRVLKSARKPKPVFLQGDIPEGLVKEKLVAMIPQVKDLDEAIGAGLVHAKGPEQGGPWTVIEERLSDLVAPLVAAGWEPGGTYYDSEWRYGAIATYALRSDGTDLLVELYDHGQVTVYLEDGSRPEDDPDWDGAPTPALFTVYTEEHLKARFRRRGWLKRR